jgi:hypothetical protein
MTISLYRFDENLDIVEKGECELGRALKTLNECCEVDLRSMESLDTAMSESSFGLFKSENDFIEISYDGKGLVSVHADRLHFPNRLSKWLSLHKHLYGQGDKGQAEKVVQDYFQLDRQAFEVKYAKFYCR